MAPADGRPRIVACDVDGTVVRSDGTISDRTVKALRLAEEAGATIVFVTGRPPRWMHDVAEQTGSRGLAIYSNGALVYDLGTRAVVLGRLLAPDAALPLVPACVRPFPASPSQSRARTASPASRTIRRGTTSARSSGSRRRRSCCPQPVAKLLARHEDMTSDELLAAAREVVGDAATLTHSSGGRGGALLEMSAWGISKASTLELICEQRGLTSQDVLAFGDMPNDLALLSWAGSAWAMGNAHPDVRAAVDSVTAVNDDDGVARVLEDVFR